MVERFLIYGHRGSPKRQPENTMESFEETLRAGADGFETDLRMLSDQTAILFHDDELEEEDIESLSMRVLRERGVKVSLVHGLGDFAGRTQMILEVKRSKWEDVLLKEVAEWPNVVVTSFDHSLVPEVRKRRHDIELGITVFGYLLDLPGYAKRLGVSWVYPSFRYTDAAQVEALHAHGIRVVPWTVNRPRDWERLHAIGCDGVITDYPAEAVAWRDGAAAPRIED
ncbi:MAG TPA: glycerophosphodiester phosphodiesterase [Thermoanaerobaculia bacterium]|jgi:glycerophosphoryl diester phosphodiesterase